MAFPYHRVNQLKGLDKVINGPAGIRTQDLQLRRLSPYPGLATSPYIWDYDKVCLVYKVHFLVSFFYLFILSHNLWYFGV
jgi:hypothetical protein